METPETYFLVARERGVVFIREVYSTNASAIRYTKRQAFEMAKYIARPRKRSQNPHTRMAADTFLFINLSMETQTLERGKFLPANGEEFPPAPAWWKASNLKADGYYGDAPAQRPVSRPTPAPQAAPTVNLGVFTS
jgi:hypothetical protein